MKDLILNYIKDTELVKYNDLTKTFGLSIEKIAIIFNLDVEFYNDNESYFLMNIKGEKIYKYEYEREFWVKYDHLGNVIFNSTDSGDWEKYFYDTSNNFIGIENKYHKKTWSYDLQGNKINEKTKYK